MARIIGPRMPSPSDLVDRVYSGSGRPLNKLRSEGLLAGDSPLVPQEIRKTGDQQKREVLQFWDDSEEYWDDSLPGYDYENRAGQLDANGNRIPGMPVLARDSSTDTSPAPLSLIPTSSIHPERPRTVAAGYDPPRRVLTVVFRDGTFYNYYDVAATTWGNFKRVHSKGQFIKKYLDGHRRGAANMFESSSWSDDGYMETLYRVARTAQIAAEGLQKNQVAGKRRRKQWKKSWYNRTGYKTPEWARDKRRTR